MNQHNNCEDKNQTATLPDLPLNSEREEETKGGQFIYFPDDKESPVEDLSVNAVEAGEVKGGAVIYRNINGTWTALSSDPAVDSTSNQHGTHVAGTIAAFGN